MSPEEIRTAVNMVLTDKVVMTYSQLSIFVLFAGIAAYFGAYLKKKGENLATKEDIARLTQQVEEIKITYSKQIEDYKAEHTARLRAAEVADFFTEWSSTNADVKKLNGFAMTLSLWLPYDIYCKIARCVCYETGAPTPKEILIDVRRYLLKQDSGKMTADNIIHFPHQQEIKKAIISVAHTRADSGPQKI